MSMPCSADIEVTETINMVRFVYQFYTKCSALFSDNIELFLNILENTKELIIRRYDNPLILTSVFTFLPFVVNILQDKIIDDFVPISFVFLLTPSYDPTRTNYQKLFESITYFHIVLSKKSYKKFSILLSKTLKSYGASEEFCSNYIQILECDVRLIPQKIRSLSSELFIIINGSRWLNF